jgi:P4 family phage/plasmid primase-like protien
MSESETVHQRLSDAGLSSDRYVTVEDGSKRSLNHKTRDTIPRGNYGVYAKATDELVLIDIDDYGDLDNRSGLNALSHLPATFEQESANGGTHRFYRAKPTDDGKLIAAVFEEVFDSKNPNPSFGEVRVANQYVVGAGSELDSGKQYTVQANREIAAVECSELVEVLTDDPDLSDKSTLSDDEAEENSVFDLDDASERLEFAFEHDDKLKRLFNGDYSDYGNDRSAAESALAWKLAFWFECDKKQVRRLMDQANTKKWDSRQDASYRDSILKAVDKQPDTFDSDQSYGSQSNYSDEKPPLDATSERPASEAQAVADSGETTQQTEADGGTTTATGGSAEVQAPIEQVVRRHLQEVEQGVIQAKTGRHRIAKAMLNEWDFVYPEESVRNWRTKLYVYEPTAGVYEPRGEAFIERKLEVLAGDYVTNQVRNEIVGKIERMSKTDMELSTDPERLVVGNGILDLHTGELDDYTATEYHSTKIEVDWNPDAGDPEEIDAFLHDIVEDQAVSTLYRLIAHTLYKEYLGEKAAILIGSGSNGKSMFLSLIEEFLGGYNVAHRELQDFDDDGFAANNLQGKMANLATEIGEQEIDNATTFKKLTGRDSMQARVKYEKPVKFENFATLMFATNEMPVFGQDNHAIWRRWLYVDFPYTFDADDPNAKDPQPERVLKQDLFTDEEFEALLVRCQREIQRWFTGEPFFSDAMDAEEVRTKMKRAAEPVYHFATTCLESTGDDDDFVKKETVRTCYKEFAAEEDLPRIAENEFGKRLMALRDMQLDSKQRRVGDSRPWVYESVQFTSRGRQLLGRDDPDDNDQQQVGDTEQAKGIVLERCREMVEETDDVEPIPREGLVWGCSTDMGKTTAENAIDTLLREGELYEPQADHLLPT